MCRLKGQPRSWLPAGQAALTLVSEQPVKPDNGHRSAYIKISTGKSGGGLSNTGYWGIPIEKDHEYQLAVIIQTESDEDVDNQVGHTSLALLTS